MQKIESSPVRWWHSVAVKSCLIAFVATHIPLLGLIAFVVTRPDALSPLNVFILALVLTLAATALVITVLWRMFAPLRRAADGLNQYMTRGHVFRGDGGSAGAAGADEIGRMVQVLVRSLAHLDRARAPLLEGSASSVGEAAQGAGVDPASRQWFALLEVDQWEALDREVGLQEMLRVHNALGEAVEKLLWPGEFAMPWGRGRFLAILGGSGADVIDRLRPLCREIPVDGGAYTATAALDAQNRGARPSAAALQRLDHKLFFLRAEGRRAVAA